MSERPPRPAGPGLDPRQLEFTPQQRMVNWFSPFQAWRTGAQAAVSRVLGDFTDKREIQAALLPPQAADTLRPYAEERDLWIDYVADLGDGFNPTYSIASLLARPSLDVARPGGQDAPRRTQRGSILVMGGDQVYPAATIPNYQNRTIGPYRAALCWSEPGEHPHLYAIPGNHDWYDGLTSFLRVFCRQQWIGGWRTRQQYSYFALKLAERWWLWGIDIQFDSYIDEPQLAYFRGLANAQVAAGDAIILCIAKPTWVQADMGRPDAHANLDYFERSIIAPSGARLRLTLAGDWHHYARYEQVPGGTEAVQRITSGGGGAYLSATHRLPQRITVPPEESTVVGRSAGVAYQRCRTFPDAATSRRLRWGALWWLPLRNPGLVSIFVIVHLVYRLEVPSSYKDLPAVALSMVAGPLAMPLTIGLAVGLTAFTQARSRTRRLALGLPHAAAHFLLIVVWIALTRTLIGAGAPTLPLPPPLSRFVVVAALAVPGALLSAVVLALYLLVADACGLNTNELFLAQRNQDYKSFVRLHLAADQTLTVYAIGLRKVARKWRLTPPDEQRDTPAWIAPDGPALMPELIDDPVILTLDATPGRHAPRPGLTVLH